MARKQRRRGFNQGSIRKRGNSWSICWRENGRRCFASAPDEDTAKKMLAKIVSDVALGRVGIAPDKSNAPTLGELAEKWLERREKTHRAASDDRCRWRVHLEPAFGRLRPSEVDAARLRTFVEGRLAAGLSPTTAGHCVRLLSTFFADIIDMGHATSNPVASLPRSTRRLYKSTYDCKTTPFLQTLADVKRVFLALPEQTGVMFACAAFLGLRTGECLGLMWQDFDFQARRVRVSRQIRHGQPAPTKDSETRVLPLQDSLTPILQAWKLKTGGQGYLFAPTVPGRGGRPELGADPEFVRPQTLHAHLKKALEACNLPALTWYEATRHTFASLFVMNGGSIELLRLLMGHSSVTTTERYSHARQDLFASSTFATMSVDLAAPAGAVVSLAPVGTLGGRAAADEVDTRAQVA